LTTNGVVVTDALKYVQGKLDHLNTTEKALLQDIKEDSEEHNQVDIEEQKNSQWDFLIFVSLVC
jgi:hypothetical protein